MQATGRTGKKCIFGGVEFFGPDVVTRKGHTQKYSLLFFVIDYFASLSSTLHLFHTSPPPFKQLLWVATITWSFLLTFVTCSSLLPYEMISLCYVSMLINCHLSKIKNGGQQCWDGVLHVGIWNVWNFCPTRILRCWEWETSMVTLHSSMHVTMDIFLLFLFSLRKIPVPFVRLITMVPLRSTLLVSWDTSLLLLSSFRKILNVLASLWMVVGRLSTLPVSTATLPLFLSFSLWIQLSRNSPPMMVQHLWTLPVNMVALNLSPSCLSLIPPVPLSHWKHVSVRNGKRKKLPISFSKWDWEINSAKVRWDMWSSPSSLHITPLPTRLCILTMILFFFFSIYTVPLPPASPAPEKPQVHPGSRFICHLLFHADAYHCAPFSPMLLLFLSLYLSISLYRWSSCWFFSYPWCSSVFPCMIIQTSSINRVIHTSHPFLCLPPLYTLL